MKERLFQVTIDWIKSEKQREKMGVPQGIILSVTLFAIKIMALAATIPQDIHKSLYVDDVQIAFSDGNMKTINQKLQGVINKIKSWATLSGFRFSTTKTVCMSFYKGVTPVMQPALKVGKHKIPVVNDAKCLGLYWDRNLTWNAHIGLLKAKATKSLNILRTLSGHTWDADRKTSIRVYRLVIRPKLDYGCIVYGAASETLLGSLHLILHEAMRIAAGAFRSTPIENLHILTNETALHYRKTELLLRYYFKNKCYLLNPAYSCVVNRNLEDYFLSRSYNLLPIVLHIREALHKRQCRLSL